MELEATFRKVPFLRAVIACALRELVDIGQVALERGVGHIVEYDVLRLEQHDGVTHIALERHQWMALEHDGSEWRRPLHNLDAVGSGCGHEVKRAIHLHELLDTEQCTRATERDLGVAAIAE